MRPQEKSSVLVQDVLKDFIKAHKLLLDLCDGILTVTKACVLVGKQC